MRLKHGAMEMSVGTIVTIVLLMAVLVLGIFLVQKIFGSATGAIDLTDQQLREEINKLFSEERKLVIYPGTRFVEIKQGETDGVGIGIKNLLTGVSGTKKFNYNVEVSDPTIDTKCGIDADIAESWIATGKEERDIPIAIGDIAMGKVLLNIPVGSPLCTIRYRVNVDAEGDAYATDFFDIEVKAK